MKCQFFPFKDEAEQKAKYLESMGYAILKPVYRGPSGDYVVEYANKKK